MNAWQFRSVRFQRKKTSSFDYYKVLYTGTEMLIELLFRLFSPLLSEETGSLYRKRFPLVERQVHVLKYVIKKSTEFNKIRRNLSEQLLDADEIHTKDFNLFNYFSVSTGQVQNVDTRRAIKERCKTGPSSTEEIKPL